MTATPSEPSHHPPLHSPYSAPATPPNCHPHTPPPPHHPYPQPLSFPLFSPLPTVQKLYFWLTTSKHKASSHASRRSPNWRGLHPILDGESTHKAELDLSFSHYHFHTRLSHLAFGWCALYPLPLPPPPSTAFSRSELNDRLDNRLINEPFLMSVHAHCRVWRTQSGRISLGPCATTRALQLAAQ